MVDKYVKPYKVIMKYFNENKKVQYNVYIYVGKHSLKYKALLDKLEPMSFYDIITELTKREMDELIKIFGEKWYLCIFTTYNIHASLNTINKDEDMKKKVIAKNGKEWFNNVYEHANDLLKVKANYSYNDAFKQAYLEKMGKKIKKMDKNNLEDYQLSEVSKNQNMIIMHKIQSGGNIDSDVYYEDSNEENVSEVYEDEVIDFDNIEMLYNDEIFENKDTKKTDAMVEELYHDDIENVKNKMTSFDATNDENYTTVLLEDNNLKKFVYSQYILDDDTIKSVKQKITCTILNNEKFGKNNYIIPSRMYLWSEYTFNKDIKKVNLCHMWTKNNQMVDINVEILPLYKYETLEDVAKNMYNAFQNFSSKIHYEDNDSKILLDFSEYMHNREIYMCDVYNVIGKGYVGTDIKISNIKNTLLKIYYPKIKTDDHENIFNYLNNTSNNENLYIDNVFNFIYNNMLMDNEIVELIEGVNHNYHEEFSNYYIKPHDLLQVQMFLHVKCVINEKLYDDEQPNIDLFRIFNNFKTSEIYPFVQLHIFNKDIVIKYNVDYMLNNNKTNESIDNITKWFETAPYGISFKVVTKKRVLPIVMNEIGKIVYKVISPENQHMDIEEVEELYEYIINLLKYINKIMERQPQKFHFILPTKNDFKFQFINAIQHFELPEKSKINFSSFTEFSKYFYPYVSRIMDSKKKTSKYGISTEVKKNGTYLQYKRISKYSSENKIEQRILAYLSLKHYNDEEIILDLEKNFGMTESSAIKEIENVKLKHEKILKNIIKRDKLSKFKQPGVRIEIQGKSQNNYKIRIQGCKNYEILKNIYNFVNIMLYLYYEIFVKKNKLYVEIKNKLMKITTIAEKRNLVDVIIDEDDDGKMQEDEEDVNGRTIIKKMKIIDKSLNLKKVGNKKYQYSRLCQNSGEHNRKRPKTTLEENVDELLKNGYSYNKKTEQYEKTISTKKKGKIVLRTLKINNDDLNDPKKNIYYTCDPDKNGEHMFIGFLSENPAGNCLPCCFKINPFETKNKTKIEYYSKCMSGNCDSTVAETNDDNSIKNLMEQLYILKDYNKLTTGRFCYLPLFLNLLFNKKHGNNISIKNFYLMDTTKNGYYFCYGIDINNYSFISTLSVLTSMTPKNIKQHIYSFFEEHDKEEQYYNALCDGNIASKYKQKDFLNLMDLDEQVDYYYLKDIIKIPGLFTEKGIYPIVFKKIYNETMNEDYLIDIDETMSDDTLYNIEEIKNKDVLLLLKDGNYYYPIVNIEKKNKKTKDYVLNKYVIHKNIIDDIIDFLNITINDIKSNYIIENKTANHINIILNNMGKKKFKIMHQVIDSKKKCRYVVLNNKTIVPCKPSRIIENVNIVCLGDSENQGCINRMEYLSLDNTLKNLELIYEESDALINTKPVGIYYQDKENDSMTCIGVYTSNNDIVPCVVEKVSKKYLESKMLDYKNVPLEYEINKKLQVYDKNVIDVFDDRIIKINDEKYKNEHYNLFKFELSHFLNNEDNVKVKKKIDDYIENKELEKIEETIYALCSNMKGFVMMIENMPDNKRYVLNNTRETCEIIETKEGCNRNIHCGYDEENKKCKFVMDATIMYKFIKKVSKELYDNGVNSFEILRKKNYFISDIIEMSIFKEFPGEKVVKSSNVNISNILNTVFANKLPEIGKRLKKKNKQQELDRLIAINQLRDIKDKYIQSIIPNNYSILRAYTNCYYWIKHERYSVNSKKLNYYSEYQNELLNLFISAMIDWMLLQENQQKLLMLDNSEKNILLKSIDLYLANTETIRYHINRIIIDLIKNDKSNNLYLLELFILNHLHNINISVSINTKNTYYISNGHINMWNDNNNLNKSVICINVENFTNGQPQTVESLHYFE